jgi:hypothetical protein
MKITAWILSALIVLVFLFACQSPTSTPVQTAPPTGTTPSQPLPTPPIVVTIPPPAAFGTLKAVFYDGTTAKMWDGSQFVTWKTGTAVKASGGGMTVSIGTDLYTIQTSGAYTQTAILPNTPRALTFVAGTGGIARSLARSAAPISSGADVWTFADVSTEDMNAQGIYYGTRTHIYKNSTEILPWYFGTVASAFVAGNGDVITLGSNGTTLTDMTRAVSGIITTATPGGLVISYDSTSFYVIDSTGTTYTYPISGIGPWPSAPDTFWLEGSKWVSTFGQSWSAASGWAVGAVKLVDFNGNGPTPVFLNLANAVRPFLVYCGDVGGISYLIETVSGHLIKFDSSLNTYSDAGQIFAGQTNDNTLGIQRIATIQPSFVGAVLYWHYNGTLWSTDTTNMITSAFMPDTQMWVVQ